MDETLAREHAELRMRRAPLSEGDGPLAHAIEREDTMTADNGAAIDDAGYDRRKLAAGRRHHRLIEPGETLVYAPLSDEHAALQVASERNEIALGKPLADRERTFRALRRLFQLSGIDVSLCNWQQQVPLLDAVLRMQIDQMLRAGQPAARASPFAAREQAKADPEAGTRRGEILTRFEIPVIQPLLCRQHLLVPRSEPGGPREPVQVIQVQAGTHPRAPATRTRRSIHRARSRHVRATAFPKAGRLAWLR